MRTPFLLYQREWINDAAPRKLGDKSRRTGWTYCEAYDAVSQRFKQTQARDADYWFSSADESAGLEFIEYCRFWAKDLFGAIADQFVEGIEDPQTRREATAFIIRCPNGRKIVAMTSNPRRFRSKGGDVCLDEFGFHDDPRAMYTAAAPVTTWGGTLRVFSTPNGEGSEFNKLVTRCRKLLVAAGYDPDRPRAAGLDWDNLTALARQHGISPIFSYHRVTIDDAIAQGIVEKINETRGTHWTREDFRRDCREKCLDEESFAQEYLCVPGMDAQAWLTYALIESCEHDDCPAVDDELKGYTGGPCHVGVDVGRVHDLTVVWTWEKVGDVLWTRQVRRFKGMPIPDQVEQITALLTPLKLATLDVDITGLGIGLYDGLKRRFGGRVHGVNFASSVKSGDDGPSIPVKQSIAVALKEVFEEKRARIPAGDGSLREALHKVRKTTTATGRVTFQAESDAAGHADEFWAAGLGIAGGKVNETGLREPPPTGVRWPRQKVMANW